MDMQDPPPLIDLTPDWGASSQGWVGQKWEGQWLPSGTVA